VYNVVQYLLCIIVYSFYVQSCTVSVQYSRSISRNSYFFRSVHPTLELSPDTQPPPNTNTLAHTLSHIHLAVHPQGLRSCHTGYRKTSGWTFPVGLLNSKGIMKRVNNYDGVNNDAESVRDYEACIA
jgi:hypothetical protein